MTEDSRLGKPWLDVAVSILRAAEQENIADGMGMPSDPLIGIGYALIGIGEVLGDLVTTTAAASLAREREAKKADTRTSDLLSMIRSVVRTQR